MTFALLGNDFSLSIVGNFSQFLANRSSIITRNQATSNSVTTGRRLLVSTAPDNLLAGNLWSSTPAPSQAPPAPRSPVGTAVINMTLIVPLLSVFGNKILGAPNVAYVSFSQNSSSLPLNRVHVQAGYNVVDGVPLKTPASIMNLSLSCDITTWCGRFAPWSVVGNRTNCTCTCNTVRPSSFWTLDVDCSPTLTTTYDEVIGSLTLPSLRWSPTTLTKTETALGTFSVDTTTSSRSQTLSATSITHSMSRRSRTRSESQGETVTLKFTPTPSARLSPSFTVRPSLTRWRGTASRSEESTESFGNVTRTATEASDTLAPPLTHTATSTDPSSSISHRESLTPTVIVAAEIFILPPPALSPSAAAIQQTVVTTAAASGAALASPGAAMQAARAMAVLALSQCRFDYNALAPFPVSLWPGFNVDAARGLYFRGAVIAALATMIFSIALGLVLVLLLARRFAPAAEKAKRYPSPAYAAKRLHYPGVLTLVVGIGLDGLVTSATAIFLHGENRMVDIALCICTVVLLAAYLLAVSIIGATVAKTGCSYGPRSDDTAQGDAAQKVTVKFFSSIDDTFRGSEAWIPLNEFDDEGNDGGGSASSVQRWFVTPKNMHGAVGSVYKKYRVSKQWFYIADVSLTVCVAIAKGTMPQSRTGCWVALGVVMAVCAVAFALAVAVRPYTAPIKNLLLMGTTGLTLCAVCLVFVAVTTSNEALMHVGQFASLLAGYVALGNVFVVVYTEFAQHKDRREKKRAKAKRIEAASRERSRLNAAAFSTSMAVDDDAVRLADAADTLMIDDATPLHGTASRSGINGSLVDAMKCNIALRDDADEAATVRTTGDASRRRVAAPLGGGVSASLLRQHDDDGLDDILASTDPTPLARRQHAAPSSSSGKEAEQLQQHLHALLRRAPPVVQSHQDNDDFRLEPPGDFSLDALLDDSTLPREPRNWDDF